MIKDSQECNHLELKVLTSLLLVFPLVELDHVDSRLSGRWKRGTSLDGLLQHQVIGKRIQRSLLDAELDFALDTLVLVRSVEDWVNFLFADIVLPQDGLFKIVINFSIEELEFCDINIFAEIEEHVFAAIRIPVVFLLRWCRHVIFRFLVRALIDPLVLNRNFLRSHRHLGQFHLNTWRRKFDLLLELGCFHLWDLHLSLRWRWNLNVLLGESHGNFWSLWHLNVDGSFRDVGA